MRVRLSHRKLVSILSGLLVAGSAAGCLPGGDGGPDGNNTRETTLAIQVVDEDGLPVEGAEVVLGETTLATDAQGRARFSGVAAGRAVAVVRASGHAPASVVSVLAEGVATQQVARLLSLGEPIPFDADLGARLEREHVRVAIPAAALVDAEGNPVTGEVEATIVPLDPTGDRLGAMPGPLEGIPLGVDGQVDIMSIFMAEISLWQNGQKVNLAEGQTATIEFILPDALQDGYDEGDTIEAWVFDLEAGIWRQEGEGEVRRSSTHPTRLSWYFEAPHFSWWNADKPWYTRNCVQVTVVEAGTDTPVSGAQVQALGLDFQGSVLAQGHTNADGQTCINFMLGGTIQVGALHPDFLHQIGGVATLTGNEEASSCGGEGAECLSLTIELSNAGTCLDGTVTDSEGGPVEGADVYATFESLLGVMYVHATSGADGGYCVNAPLDADVSLVATHAASGMAASASVFTSSVDFEEASCGAEGCTEVEPLVLDDRQTGCLRGRVVTYDPAAQQQVPIPGVPVQVFATEPARSCDPGSDHPAAWGPVLATATTDINGEYCLPVPWSGGVDEVYVSAGACHEVVGMECLSSSRQMKVELDREGSCREGGCVKVTQLQLANDCNNQD